MGYVLYCKGSQLDQHWEPHCRRQLRQESCLTHPSQPYGSNTAHCLREWTNTLLAMPIKYLILVSPLYSRVFFMCVQFLALSVTRNLCEPQRWRCNSCDVVTHVLAHARLITKPVLEPQDSTTHFEFIFNPKMLAFKADSHIACRAHGASMPFPCHAVR
jgi:hypothetical protein